MPYILPQPQVRQTGWDQAGFATGVIGDILLKALLAGQIGGRPSAGVFTSPTGATTTISPAERVKGAPNVRLADLISKQGQGSFLPTQYSGVQLQPDLSRQLQQAQLGYLQSATNQLNQPAATTPSPTPPPSPSPTPTTSPLLTDLFNKAKAGDARSLDAIRLLALEKNDPDAIALLTSLGEL